MDLSTLLLACSVHADDALLQAIAFAHGGGSPYAIVDVSTATASQDGPVHLEPRTVEDARAALLQLTAAGGELVVGLLPVRPDWAADFGKSAEELFDACIDVQVASAKISEFDYQCRSRGPLATAPARRACTLDRYGASVGYAALRVVVLSALGEPPPASAPDLEYSPPVETSVGSSGLFFQVAVAPQLRTWDERPPPLAEPQRR